MRCGSLRNTRPTKQPGLRCSHPRFLDDKPVKLRRTSESEICDQCSKVEAETNLEASQRRLGTYPRLEELKDNPEKKRIVALKRELVAQMLGYRASFEEGFTRFAPTGK
jgi:hypothetical protein